MANNIEIKARVHDVAALKKAAEAAAGKEAEVINQTDTFFYSNTGRLKLREFPDGSGELISYFRENSSEPVPSDYQIYRTSKPDVLRHTLQMTLGVRGVVRKTRQLHMVGRTRIHLDDVEGLGHFMELEVVLEPGENPEVGEKEARQLMQKLGILEENLIECAYVDLLGDS